MGYYIQGPTKGKVEILVKDHGAVITTLEEAFKEVITKGVICVIDNGPFEAAGYCYNLSEFEAFAYPDGRPKTWLVMDKDKAEKLSRYKR